MATGYYYYGARYYDPKRSFMLSVDPLVELTMSPYAYVWNDPVNYMDPTGMYGQRVGGDPPGNGKKTIKDCFGGNGDPPCGTCGRKESKDQRNYRLFYQGLAASTNFYAGGKLSAKQSDNEVTPFSLFYQFSYGTGKSIRNLDENSNMGKGFLKIDEVQTGIDNLIDGYIDNGKKSQNFARNLPKKYDTGNQTLDAVIYHGEALSHVLENAVDTFQGSFNGNAKITNVEYGYLIDTYSINITSTEYMGAQSGTRDAPKNSKYSGKSTIPNNYYGKNGYFRTIQLNYNLNIKVNRPAIGRQIKNIFEYNKKN